LHPVGLALRATPSAPSARWLSAQPPLLCEEGNFAALVVRHHRHELLDSLILFHLAGIDVALGIHRDRVDPVKLAGIGAVTAESAECLPAVAVENPYFVIGAVSHVSVLLLRVVRERKFVGRSARRKLLVIKPAANLAARWSVG